MCVLMRIQSTHWSHLASEVDYGCDQIEDARHPVQEQDEKEHQHDDAPNICGTVKASEELEEPS